MNVTSATMNKIATPYSCRSDKNAMKKDTIRSSAVAMLLTTAHRMARLIKRARCLERDLRGAGVGIGFSGPVAGSEDVDWSIIRLSLATRMVDKARERPEQEGRSGRLSNDARKLIHCRRIG